MTDNFYSNLGGGSPFAKIAVLLGEHPAGMAHETVNGRAKLPKSRPKEVLWAANFAKGFRLVANETKTADSQLQHLRETLQN